MPAKYASFMISPTNPMDNVSNQPHEKHILFLDGECVICQRSARLLHKWDRVGEVYFSTLQGKTAAMLPAEWKRLTDERGRPAGTAVLVENAGRSDERRWRSADAILRSLRLTQSILSVFWVIHIIPRFIKDGGYRFIARNRHRLSWGKRSCPLPDQDFKDKFLP